MRAFFWEVPHPLPVLGRRELVITRYVASERERRLASQIDISRRTSRHFVSVDAKDAASALPFLAANGIKNVLLRFSPGENAGAEFRRVRESFLSFRFGAVLGFDERPWPLEKELLGLCSGGAEPVFLEPLLETTAANVARLKNALAAVGEAGVKKFLYITPWQGGYRWEINCRSTLFGPREVHMDLSNKCTHSCHFCGLYADEAIAEVKKGAGGLIPTSLKEQMKLEMDRDQGVRILDSLPENVHAVQFGGMGDPALHPDFLEFVRVARERGFGAEILSNMSYFSDEDVHALHELSGDGHRHLHFIANISASDEKGYVRTRPRQKAEDFQRVISTLARFRELSVADGKKGVALTMMMVLTRDSFRDSANYVRLAKSLGVEQVYLKPVEVHLDFHRAQVPREEEREEYRHSLREALACADALGISMMMREDLEI